MQKDVILTPEGLEKLKQEIEHLSTTRRREVAERIKEAREFGDISENSEYDDAKNEQAMLEARIAQLEDKLRSAQVIDASELDSEHRPRRLARSTGKDEKGKAFEYAIVGSTEADPAGQEALQRVPGRQGADRPQEGRQGEGAGAEGRAHAHHRQDRRRLAPWRTRAAQSPAKSCSTGGASSRSCAPPASSRSRTPSRASGPSPTSRRRTRTSPTGEETDAAARIAGRLAARRGQGKAAFLDLVDRSGRMQLTARVDVLGDDAFARLLDLDLGDLIGVDGTVIKTRARRALAAARRVRRCSRSRCGRRPTSTTAWPTSRPATAIARSTCSPARRSARRSSRARG